MHIELFRLTVDCTNLVPGQGCALHGISLSLHAGDVVGILGPSGAGKSTLLAVLAGRTTPKGGEIFVDGKKVAVDALSSISRLDTQLSDANAFDDAAVILLDEPMPAPTRSDLHLLPNARQRTIVIATQSIPLTTALCDWVALLYAGHLLAKMPVADLAKLTRGATAEIHVRGHLDRDWADWFGGLTMTYPHSEETLMRGTVRDQTELYGILARIRDLSIPLISVNTVVPDLEQIIADVCAQRLMLMSAEETTADS